MSQIMQILPAFCTDHEKIKLEEVKAITLHKGQWSTGRRNPAVPQLKCVGGSAASTAHTPNVVQVCNKNIFLFINEELCVEINCLGQKKFMNIKDGSYNGTETSFAFYYLNNTVYEIYCELNCI